MRHVKSVFVLIALIGIGIMPSNLANAQPSQQSGTNTQVLSQTTDYVLVGIGGTRTKTTNRNTIASLVQSATNYIGDTNTPEAPESGDSTAQVYHDYYDASDAEPFSDGHVEVWYNDHHAKGVSGGCLGTCNKIVVNGYTQSNWSGLNPFYPTKMKMTETWTYDGLGWTLTFPPGGSFTAAGSTVTYQTEEIDGIAEELYGLGYGFKKVKGKIYGIAWGEEDVARAEYRFGGAIVNAVADGCGFVCP